MSCMYCTEGCGRLIDTDDEPESFCKIRQPDGSLKEECLCVWCREEHPEEDVFDLDGSPFYA